MRTGQPLSDAERPSLAATFSHGFRPFFALAALAAVLLPTAWLALLAGWRWSGAPTDPLHWHAHEMLYGFVAAAIAGFLLTAVPGFTQRPPLVGAPLFTLAMLWLSARLAAAFAGTLPAALVAMADVGFLLAIALVAARDVVAASNRRNLVLVALVLLLAVTALAEHLRLPAPGTTPGLYVVVLLLTLLGGRIVPAFTGNWLRAEGGSIQPVRRAWLEVGVVGLTLATAVCDTFAPPSWVAVAAASAALAHAVRLAGWRGTEVRAEPLLLVLHAGYAWLVVGFVLLALASLGLAPRVAALHAFGVGAMGTMILGVMSRAALGHTGRVLRATRPMTVAFVLVTLAAVARVGASLYASAWMPMLAAAGLAWSTAFAIYLWHFLPMLVRPRVS